MAVERMLRRTRIAAAGDRRTAGQIGAYCAAGLPGLAIVCVDRSARGLDHRFRREPLIVKRRMLPERTLAFFGAGREEHRKTVGKPLPLGFGQGNVIFSTSAK